MSTTRTQDLNDRTATDNLPAVVREFFELEDGWAVESDHAYHEASGYRIWFFLTGSTWIGRTERRSDAWKQFSAWYDLDRMSRSGIFQNLRNRLAMRPNRGQNVMINATQLEAAYAAHQSSIDSFQSCPRPRETDSPALAASKTESAAAAATRMCTTGARLTEALTQPMRATVRQASVDLARTLLDRSETLLVAYGEDLDDAEEVDRLTLDHYERFGHLDRASQMMMTGNATYLASGGSRRLVTTIRRVTP